MYQYYKMSNIKYINIVKCVNIIKCQYYKIKIL